MELRRINQTAPHASRRGFSLIEVMVSVSIFAIIVLMMAALFQQSNNAWRAGNDQAQGYVTLRSVMGMLQRDMANMIDEPFMTNACGIAVQDLQLQKGQSLPLSFYKLRSPVARDDNGQAVQVRGYSFVEWTLGGSARRSETLFNPDGSAWKTLTIQLIEVGDGQVSFDTPREIRPADARPAPAGAPAYQLRATVSAQAKNSYDIGAWSWGPNKNEGVDPETDPDVIRTWLGN